MSDLFSRLHAMMELIPRYPRKISATELVRKLDEYGYQVSKRTIERDLDELSGSEKYALTCDDSSKPYGWSWAKNANLNFLKMDSQTALTFVIVEQFIRQVIPTTTRHYLDGYFKEAKGVLDSLKKRYFAKWPDKVRMLPRGQRLIPAPIKQDVVDVVYEGLLNDRKIKLKYKNRAGDRKACEISPLGLVFRDSITYLVCRFWHYEDIRYLALHRILDAELLDEPAEPPRGFKLDDYIDEGPFEFRTSDKKIRLKVLMDNSAAKHLYETRLCSDQRLTEKNDGRTLLQATVQDSSELRWWLLAFGDQVEVLAPKALRKEFKVTAARLHKLYSPRRVTRTARR